MIIPIRKLQNYFKPSKNFFFVELKPFGFCTGSVRDY